MDEKYAAVDSETEAKNERQKVVVMERRMRMYMKKALLSAKDEAERDDIREQYKGHIGN